MLWPSRTMPPKAETIVSHFWGTGLTGRSGSQEARPAEGDAVTLERHPPLSHRSSFERPSAGLPQKEGVSVVSGNDRLRTSMLRKRILLTNATDNAGLSVIRDLAATGHELIGVDSRRLPLGLRSRCLRTVHALPAPADSRFDQSLVELVRAVGPDAFLPLGTKSVAAACCHAAELSRLTAINVPGQEAFTAAFDHAVCGAECAQWGIPCPAAYSLEEAARILADGGGSVTLVVKPRTDVGAASGVSYVNDPDALRRSVSACTARFGGAIVQEHIPGDVSAMRTVVVLFDRQSELIAAFTTRKRCRCWADCCTIWEGCFAGGRTHEVRVLHRGFRVM